MHDFYPTLLSPLRVGGRVLKNRMICPPSAPGHAGPLWALRNSHSSDTQISKP